MKTRNESIGDLTILFECEPCDGKYLDTKATINGELLCWISWPEIDNMILELNIVFSKYRI